MSTAMHWLSDAIATLEKEAARWKHSDGGKSESHATAAALLTKVAESGASHEEVKAQLATGFGEDADGPDITAVHELTPAPTDVASMVPPTTSHDPADSAPPTG